MVLFCMGACKGLIGQNPGKTLTSQGLTNISMPLVSRSGRTGIRNHMSRCLAADTAAVVVSRCNGAFSCKFRMPKGSFTGFIVTVYPNARTAPIVVAN